MERLRQRADFLAAATRSQGAGRRVRAAGAQARRRRAGARSASRYQEGRQRGRAQPGAPAAARDRAAGGTAAGCAPATITCWSDGARRWPLPFDADARTSSTARCGACMRGAQGTAVIPNDRPTKTPFSPSCCRRWCCSAGNISSPCRSRRRSEQQAQLQQQKQQAQRQQQNQAQPAHPCSPARPRSRARAAGAPRGPAPAPAPRRSRSPATPRWQASPRACRSQPTRLQRLDRAQGRRASTTSRCVKFRETVDPKSPPIVLLSPSGSPRSVLRRVRLDAGRRHHRSSCPTPTRCGRKQGSGALAVGHPVTLT